MSDRAAVLTALTMLAVIVGFWCLIGYVAYHFISMYW